MLPFLLSPQFGLLDDGRRLSMAEGTASSETHSARLACVLLCFLMNLRPRRITRSIQPASGSGGR
jgi:hypothetical protein